MKRTGACSAWLAPVLILALASNAAADESGPYVSAGVGVIDTPDISRLADAAPVLQGRTDDDELSWNVGVGYRFNPNIALELGYVDLGKIQADLADPSGASDATGSSSFAADGTTFAMVGTFPIGRWEPYLKTGVLFSTTELRFRRTVGSTTSSGRITDDNEDPFYAAGVRFTVTEPLQVYLDLTFFDDVGEPETGRSSYFNWSTGVLWRF